MAKPKLIKLINGAPALMLVNGKEHKKMASKTTHHQKKAAPKKAAHKKHNPHTHASGARKHKARPRRNPAESLLFKVVAGLAGLAGTNFVSSYVNSWFPQVATSPIVRILSKAGIGYGLGWGVRRFAPAGFKGYGTEVAFGGYMAAGVDGFNYAFPTLQTVFLPGGGAVNVAATAQPTNPDGTPMQDVVDLPAGEDDQYFGSSPDFGGMHDVVEMDENQYFQ